MLLGFIARSTSLRPEILARFVARSIDVNSRAPGCCDHASSVAEPTAGFLASRSRFLGVVYQGRSRHFEYARATFAYEVLREIRGFQIARKDVSAVAVGDGLLLIDAVLVALYVCAASSSSRVFGC